MKGSIKDAATRASAIVELEIMGDLIALVRRRIGGLQRLQIEVENEPGIAALADEVRDAIRELDDDREFDIACAQRVRDAIQKASMEEDA